MCWSLARNYIIHLFIQGNTKCNHFDCFQRTSSFYLYFTFPLGLYEIQILTGRCRDKGYQIRDFYLCRNIIRVAVVVVATFFDILIFWKISKLNKVQILTF